MMIERILKQKIQRMIGSEKAIIIMGPRQVGKSTLLNEMVENTNLLEEKHMLPHRLVYGYYPEVVTHPGEEKMILKELADSYLYKDILSLDSIGKPDKSVKYPNGLSVMHIRIVTVIIGSGVLSNKKKLII